MSKEMRIMRAIGDIEDKYIDEAAPVMNSKAIRFSSWSKYIGMAAAVVLVVGIGVFAVTQNNIGVDSPAQTVTNGTEPAVTEKTDDFAFLGNPYVEYDTLEEAVQAVGFDMSVLESFGEFTDRHIATVLDDMIEVTYYNTAGNVGLRIRKSIGTEDNSGADYYFETMLPIKGTNGTMSGITKKDGTVEIFKAVWTDGEYAYSVTAPYNSADESGSKTGFTQAEMEEIIKNVK